jgi:hypothetical protein
MISEAARKVEPLTGSSLILGRGCPPKSLRINALQDKTVEILAALQL